MERHVENALKVVDFLKNHPKVAAVHHPAIESHPDHALYKKYFPNGGGSIFTFEIKGGQEEAWKFIDALQDILAAGKRGRREEPGDTPLYHHPLTGSRPRNLPSSTSRRRPSV